jgi:hypothetical protein
MQKPRPHNDQLKIHADIQEGTVVVDLGSSWFSMLPHQARIFAAKVNEVADVVEQGIVAGVEGN